MLHRVTIFLPIETVPDDEKNLLYVAVTRAKHRLQCSTMLYSIISSRTVVLVFLEPYLTIQLIVYIIL